MIHNIVVSDLHLPKFEQDAASKLKSECESMKCSSYVYSKGTREVFPQTQSTGRAAQPLDLVQSDACSPLGVRSVGGAWYFATFIGDNSNWSVVYIVREKSESLSLLQFVCHSFLYTLWLPHQSAT